MKSKNDTEFLSVQIFCIMKIFKYNFVVFIKATKS